eukprot:jgi/Botrbrau1/6751/Bobra.0324s0036.1
MTKMGVTSLQTQVALIKIMSFTNGHLGTNHEQYSVRYLGGHGDLLNNYAWACARHSIAPLDSHHHICTMIHALCTCMCKIYSLRAKRAVSTVRQYMHTCTIYGGCRAPCISATLLHRPFNPGDTFSPHGSSLPMKSTLGAPQPIVEGHSSNTSACEAAIPPDQVLLLLEKP